MGIAEKAKSPATNCKNNFTPLNENGSNLNYETSSVHRNCKNCCEKLITVTAEKDQLQREIYRLQKEICNLKKQKEKLDNFKIFRPDQIRHLEKEKVSKWSKETVCEALQIRYACGIHGYNHLLKLGWPYPSYETLCRRVRKIPMRCGINKVVIDLLGAKVASLPEHARYCNLSIDEMDLSRKLEFDKGL